MLDTLIFLFLAVGCGKDKVVDSGSNANTDTDADTDADADTDTDTGFHPANGAWSYAEEGIVSDECGIGRIFGKAAFDLTEDGSGGFSIQPHGAIPPFQCTLKDTAYTCARSWVDGEDLTVQEIDAVWALYVSLDGDFPSETSMQGTIVGDFACAGADCAGVAEAMGLIAAPCSIELLFSGAFVE